MTRSTVLVACALCLPACTGAKPVIRTVNDIARDMCALFFSENQGISFQDAARGVCSTREVLDPFIREVLKAQRAAGTAAIQSSDAGAADAPATNP